jgi:carbon starvation protein
VYPKYTQAVFPEVTVESAKGNAILAFATAVGRIGQLGLGLPAWLGAIGATLMLGGFLLTTLDTAVRLMRYILEEIWQVLLSHYDVFHGIRTESNEERKCLEKESAIPTSGSLRLLLTVLNHYWFNTALAVGLMLALLYGTGYQAIWKVFGASNQLLASFGLLLASIWLLVRRKGGLITLIPGVLMLVTSLYALVALLIKNWATPGARPLVVADAIIVLLGIALAALLLQAGLRLKAKAE